MNTTWNAAARRRAALILILILVLAGGLWGAGARAEEIGCVTTKWMLLGANHRVCVEAFDDPKVPGVTCHLSQARTGGISGSLGLAEDPSRFSIACRQVGPITLPARLEAQEVVFSADTSLLFKETRVVRLVDRKRNTLVYLVYSTRLIEGSPMNSVSTVPIMPWTGAAIPQVAPVSPAEPANAAPAR